MGIVQVRVDESLEEVLKKIKAQVTGDLSEIFGFDLNVNGHVASKILAVKHQGGGKLRFRIKKTGLNKGVLEIL